MTRPRILVVDDEPGMQHAVRRILERQYDLRFCATAEQAVSVGLEFVPELALLDVRLPTADGFELMRRLQRAVPGIDVILMTGSLNDLDGKLIRSLREEAFFFLQKPFDRELLLTLLARWREQRRLARENADYVARLEAELAQARTFQQRMLPGAADTLGGWTLCGSYLPCDALGGDFYDWAEVGDGRVAVLIADVAGHGVAAAMLTGFVKAAFHAAHADDYAPESIAARVRDGLRGLDEGSFVTLFCARIDARRAALEFVSAGHPFAALLHADGVQVLAPTGALLTPAFPEVECAAQRAALTDRARLLLWTDGIEEATAENGELFGQRRLLEAIACGGGGASFLADIQSAVRAFVGQRPLRDDCTLVLAEPRA